MRKHSRSHQLQGVSFRAAAGYAITREHMHLGELQRRLENGREPIDVIDLRYPTWNHWAMRGRVLRGCTRIRHGRLELLVPDVESTFVFKTYPCRAADLQDLQRILEVAALRWDHAVRILDEPEAFARDQPAFAPELLVAQARGRTFASLGALDSAGVQGTRAAVDRVRERWLALGVPLREAGAVLEAVRSEGLAWERLLHRHAKTIRSALARSNATPARRAGPEPSERRHRNR